MGIANSPVTVQSKSVTKLTLYRMRQPYERLDFVLFAVAYGVAFKMCYDTFGDPYREAMAELARREEAGEFGADVTEAEYEELLAEIPDWFMPGFWANFVLCVTIIVHAISQLAKEWDMGYKAWLLGLPTQSLDTATHILATPREHRGKADLVPLDRVKSLNAKSGQVCRFEFQKRIYVADVKSGEHAFHKISAPMQETIAHYAGNAKGIPSDVEMRKLMELYGHNRFEIPIPTFWDMYQQQIRSPFFCFQILCILLWAMEEYWQYSLFSLCLLCGFEATTVKTRQLNLQKLRGMGNPARPVLVRRQGRWRKVSNEDLVPGDILALEGGRPGDEATVPCDCLLLRGVAVVNEATLTGESVPQMKEAAKKEDQTTLDVKNKHKLHILFGGTTLMEAKAKSHNLEDGDNEAAKQQDVFDGLNVDAMMGRQINRAEVCIVYVLRTGFSSSQGKLVRRIEYSTDRKISDNQQSLYLILFLLIFAVFSAGYVLFKGLEDETRTRFELLRHCILIITNVVPPDLPMQLTLAVNLSLAALMKIMVYCIEPFRIPIAGRVKVLCFDKTGTITTDQLVAAGIVTHSGTPGGAAKKQEKDDSGLPKMQHMDQINWESTAVLAGCHSLVPVDGKLLGDPLEVAAMDALNWYFDARLETGFARPPKTVPAGSAAAASKSVTATPASGSNGPAAVVPGMPQKPATTTIEAPFANGSVKVLKRHHFSSALQRMSVVARVNKNGGGQKGSSSSSGANWENWVLAKGSAEAIKRHCHPDHGVPEWYGDVEQKLAKDGMRIIALAYRKIGNNQDVSKCIEDRETAEKDLVFCGFIAFNCLLRKDSARILRNLKNSSHDILMITGDAVLTAAHVAGQVGIVSGDRKKVVMLSKDAGGQMKWTNLETGAVEADLASGSIAKLTEERDMKLCMPGFLLDEAWERNTEEVEENLEKINVYARMTPEQKEKVITTLNGRGLCTLMCGDGTNDVGALRQADVGVALLSGFGSSNAGQADDILAEAEKLDREEEEGVTASPAAGAEDAEAKALATAAARDAYLNDPNLTKEQRAARRKTLEQREEIARETAIRKARGEWFPSAKAAVAVAQREMERKQKEQQEAQRKRAEAQRNGGTVADAAAKKKDGPKKEPQSISEIWEQLQQQQEEGGDAQGEVQMVKPGDASNAAPFTSKLPSIRSVEDIIRQGRTTLMTTLQTYQILALQCLVSSYSLSVLYLDGVKYGDRQMTILALLMSVSFFMISRGKPLRKLSKLRPPTSIFEPGLFLSLLGQFAVHLGSMMYAKNMVYVHLPEDWKPDIEGKFQENLINTVIFLVTAVQQVGVFAVNYKGHPFMQGVMENTAFFQSLMITAALAITCAAELIPALNYFMQLVPLPDNEFRRTLLSVLVFDFVGAFAWDRLMMFTFLPEMFKAGIPTLQDLRPIVRFVFWAGLIVYMNLGMSADTIKDALEEYERQLEAQVNATNQVLPEDVVNEDFF
eukprot:Clim_evm31s34 gene=Clim_evmTU31s34